MTSGDNGYTNLPDEPEQPSEPVTPVDPDQPGDGGDNTEEPEIPDAEDKQHEYVFSQSFDKEGKTLTIAYECECGERYSGAIQLFITDSAGNTVAEVITGNTTLDFKDRLDDYTVIAIDADGVVIDIFEIKNKSEELKPTEPEVPGTSDDKKEPSDTTEPENPVEPTEPDNSEQPSDKQEKVTDNVMLPILVVLFGLLGAGGVVTYMLIKKNRNKTKKEKGDK